MAFTTIKFRRDTAANWTSVNPVLAAGEPGFETDTGKHKIGNGTDVYNDLPYAGSAGGEVHAGTATLASGEATISVDWVTPDTVIVALPQAAPSTAGTAIYADPADIVDATSFMIKSDDATDDRAVFWMATEPTEASEPPLELPDTFYVAFRVKFHADEISSAFDNGSTAYLFAFNTGLSNDFEFGPHGGTSSSFSAVDLFLDASPDFPDLNIPGLTIDADTYYVFDLKFDRTPDHQTIDVTVRLDGTELDTLNVSADAAWNIENMVLGQVLGTSGGQIVNRDFDYFYIGSTDYGTSDLFLADFTTDQSPFDSLVLNGGGAITFPSGAMNVSSSDDSTSYALKATA